MVILKHQKPIHGSLKKLYTTVAQWGKFKNKKNLLTKCAITHIHVHVMQRQHEIDHVGHF